MRPEPYLVVIDAQRIFADPASDWCAPDFQRIIEPLDALVPRFAGRTILTRWLPATKREGSWSEYMQRWSFADRDSSDPFFDYVDAAKEWFDQSQAREVCAPTFSKWTEDLRKITGPNPQLLLAGVATDCCVISTALAAADAGAWVRVLADCCAGADAQAHERALTLMDAYQPQIEVIESSALG